MTDEMYSRLARYFAGQATPEEEVAVQQWREESGENKDAFDEAAQLWKSSGDHQPLVFDTEAAWQKVQAALAVTGEPQQGKVVKLFNWKKAIAAAAVLVIILAGGWWFLSTKSNQQHIIADIDGKEVLLEDGSKIYLRKGTSLDYPKNFKKNIRAVALSGHAFFEIAKNPEKPFMITAAETEVKVLGTSFSVNTIDKKVEVIVKTGRVQFTSLANPATNVVLTPGERAVFVNGNFSKQKNTDINFDAWQTHQLVFSNTALEEVIKAINGYYQVHLRLKAKDRQQLSAAVVTTTFNNQSLESVIKELELITSFRIRKLNETDYEVSRD